MAKSDDKTNEGTPSINEIDGGRTSRADRKNPLRRAENYVGTRVRYAATLFMQVFGGGAVVVVLSMLSFWRFGRVRIDVFIAGTVAAVVLPVFYVTLLRKLVIYHHSYFPPSSREKEVQDGSKGPVNAGK